MYMKICIVILVALVFAIGHWVPATAEFEQMKELQSTMYGTVTEIGKEEKAGTVELRAGYNFKYLLLVTDKTKITSGENGRIITLKDIKKGDWVDATCRERTINIMTGYSSYQAGDRSGKKYPMGLITCQDTGRIAAWME
jgi:hypothetical protein